MIAHEYDFPEKCLNCMNEVSVCPRLSERLAMVLANDNEVSPQSFKSVGYLLESKTSN